MSPSGEGLLVRYWAGARAAAGTTEEYVVLPPDGDLADGDLSAARVADVVAEIESRHPELGPILEVASLLLDGRAAERDEPIGAVKTLEVLPPFAGG